MDDADDSAAAAAIAVAVHAAEERPKEDPQTVARWYQLEALERAVRGNTVAFLETGAGKTLIAVLLLRAYAHRVRRPARAFAVSLVPTVVLVEQQARVVKSHTDLRVSKFYGAMGIDFWDAATWRRVVEDAEVLPMTPQILLDNLRHSIFQLQDIVLLIFDECHHAKGDSPCACILKRLEFLGDAVLDHLFTVYYYNQYPECTPALLTDLRSASVNNNCYAHAAAKAGLNKHIFHSSSELHRKMALYLENFGQPFTGPSHGWEAGISLPKKHLKTLIPTTPWLQESDTKNSPDCSLSQPTIEKPEMGKQVLGVLWSQ